VSKRLWLVVVWALVLYFSFWGMPLAYDETWNYNEAAALGPLYTVTHYGFNNHVLYALFMSLIPQFLVRYQPFLMRIPNCLASLGLFALIGLTFELPFRSRKTVHPSVSIWQIVLCLGAVLASAQVIYFYLVGRGYLLGCALALGAIYFRKSRFYPWISDALLVLAGYALFTFNYTWPGLLLIDVVEESFSLAAFKRIVYRWARTTGALLLLYVPLLSGMRDQVRQYQTFKPAWQYTLRTLHTAFNSPYSFQLFAGAIGISIATYFITRVTRPAELRAEGPAPLLAGYLASAVISYAITTEATNALHIVAAPYDRNAMFVPLFAIVAAGLSAGTWLPLESPRTFGPIVRVAAALAVLGAIAMNGVATASAVLPTLRSGNYLRYPVAEFDCVVPVDNGFLKSLPKGTEIFCGSFAQSVCWPFRPNMIRYGLKIFPGNDDVFGRQLLIEKCWSGTVYGGGGCSLWLRQTEADPFQPLCY
jgi:hypothetical protein